MRIVTLEEHISFPEMTAKIPKPASGGFGQSEAMQRLLPKLADITGDRLRSMDENGISLQVLSVDSSGANLLGALQGPAFASEYNDLIAQKIGGFENRFTAFAHLPMTAPAAAADELERTVTKYNFRGAMIRGLTNDRFLDHPDFAPIFERAEKLNVPVYIHPGLPRKQSPKYTIVASQTIQVCLKPWLVMAGVGTQKRHCTFCGCSLRAFSISTRN